MEYADVFDSDCLRTVANRSLRDENVVKSIVTPDKAAESEDGKRNEKENQNEKESDGRAEEECVIA